MMTNSRLADGGTLHSREQLATHRRARRQLQRAGRAKRRREPPKVHWGFGAQNPNCAAAPVRLVPITSVTVQNAGTVGRAVTPGMVAALPVSGGTSDGGETGSELPSSLSSSASFSGYLPLPAPPARGGSRHASAARAMPLALSASDGRQWLVATAGERAIDTPQDRSLRQYADLYADTRPHGWSRRDDANPPSPVVAVDVEEPSLSLAATEHVPRSTLAVSSELEPESESAVSSQQASPNIPSPESSHVDSSSCSMPRVGHLWKLVQARHMQIRRTGSRDMEAVARSWVDIERDKAATAIQSHVRGRQGRAQFFAAQERLLNTVIGLQRMHRAQKNRGPAPAMLWTATLAMLAAQEQKEAQQEEAKKAKEEQLEDEQVQEQEGNQPDVVEVPTLAFEVARTTPSDRVREFLAAPPRNTSDAEVAAVVEALKAAQVPPSAWIDELQEMASQPIASSNVLEDFFLPACVKKLQQKTDPMCASNE